MYGIKARKQALALIEEGRSLSAVSTRTGISQAAIRQWVRRADSLTPSRPCPRCDGSDLPTAPYAYLLGLYLGDGCISRFRTDTHFLRIACADTWPGLVSACEDAVRAVRPDNKVFRVPKDGCVAVTAYSKHWPCLFPQHGPGKKHERRIRLEPWQQEITGAHPWEFIRGLIHSDGCRVTNWTTRPIGGERKRYEYPRYFFTNESDDIRRLFCDALDGVGVQWRQANRRNISVARRASVALMDAHVGPKY